MSYPFEKDAYLEHSYEWSTQGPPAGFIHGAPELITISYDAEEHSADGTHGEYHLLPPEEQAGQ